MTRFKREWMLHTMMLPSIILLVLFTLLPLFGLVMAFQNFNPAKGLLGSQFVDFYNFKRLFMLPEFMPALTNTLIISVAKIVLTLIFSVGLALLLNEMMNVRYKKLVQTVLFLPYFLSWILLGGLILELFQLDGPINNILATLFNAEPVNFLADNRFFRPIVIATDVWKNVGYQMVIFLAAITNINPSLYEAAEIDGANKPQLMKYITLPGITSMVILMSLLNVGNILNAGFEQILVLYNPVVYETGDILDTLSYRIGLGVGRQGGADYSLGTAVGLFKSAISCVLFAISYGLAYKFKGYRIF